MSAVRRTPAYTAERTETGGWRLRVPLDSIPSANTTTREHWASRKRRVDTLTSELLWMRAYSVRRGTAHQYPIFDRASATLALYFRDARRRDPQNYLGGAKALFDALQRSGWLADDDAEHLTVAEPVLLVDRENPRVEVTLEPWGG